jgi:3-carboxy-cis,cis-muconate cycloisomerase
MKQPSSRSDGLLDALFTSPQVEQELSDAALLGAMLEVEAALAQAEADAGVVPGAAAAAISSACVNASFDLAELGAAAVDSGNPVVPLVRAIVAVVPESAKAWVHHGATSQDVVDSALMLVAHRAGEVVLRDASAVAALCGELADRHRDSVMLARTLGQAAAPTTFGVKAAGWLVAVDSVAVRLRDVVESRLAVQLGGAAGTLGVLGDAGPRVVRLLAERLGLQAPVLPWHTDRQRILELAGALGGVVAAVGKIGLDVELLAQTGIDEVREGGGPSHGGSSAMPHKQNPVDSVLVRSAAYRAPGLVATLFATAQQEHERAAGAWHAEWQPLRSLLSIAGGAVARTSVMLAGLDVRTDRMRSAVEAAGGLVMAEHLAAKLMPVLGRWAAQALVGECCARAVDQGRDLRDVAKENSGIGQLLSAAEVDEALDIGTGLRAVQALIDAALARAEAR